MCGQRTLHLLKQAKRAQTRIYEKDILQKSEGCMDVWMELLANEVHIKGMEVLLADKVHKQEPPCK